jgi:dipeptidyl-peptidase 4
MKKLPLLLLLFSLAISAQTRKPVSLDDLNRGLFFPKYPEGINWMRDSRYYTALNETGDIVQYQVAAGADSPVQTLVRHAGLLSEDSSTPLKFADYTFSSDEKKILFLTERESIYRRSFLANYFVYDLTARKLQKLSGNGKQSYATFSPDGKRVAFVRDNNLFMVNLADMSEKAITTDGVFNKIINGSTDWVYEEEFGFTTGFFWSPESDKLSYYIFDETEVKEYNMQLWGSLYPKDYRFKYPKAGEANSKVKIAVYDVKTGKNMIMDTGSETDVYFPRVQWTSDNNLLSIKRMNRLQNRLEILHAEAATGKSKIVLSENSETYVDLEFTDDLTYLPRNKGFIQSSERSGFKHLYFFDMNGKLIRPLTAGNWEVSEVLGVDEISQTVFYTSTEVSPLERQLYSISLSGKNKRRLSSPGVQFGFQILRGQIFFGKSGSGDKSL